MRMAHREHSVVRHCPLTIPGGGFNRISRDWRRHAPRAPPRVNRDQLARQRGDDLVPHPRLCARLRGAVHDARPSAVGLRDRPLHRVHWRRDFRRRTYKI